MWTSPRRARRRSPVISRRTNTGLRRDDHLAAEYLPLQSKLLLDGTARQLFSATYPSDHRVTNLMSDVTSWRGPLVDGAVVAAADGGSVVGVVGGIYFLRDFPMVADFVHVFRVGHWAC
jgi:hypothetical protein